MPRERITRRQKDISRLLRERRQIYKDKLKTFRGRYVYDLCSTQKKSKEEKKKVGF
ncbi:MAG: hypothetical protein AB1629_03235 [Candidatus Omnitrophota bacterium]